MNMKKIAGIEIWNRPVYIKAVLGFIDSVSEAHKEIDYARYSKMRFVIGEALMRRIKNAYPGENGKIEVELYASETCFEVSIKDKGVPAWSDLFNKEAVDTDERKFKDFILNSWMDEVGMEKLGNDGQRIYMRLHFKNPLTFKEPEPYQEIEVLDKNKDCDGRGCNRSNPLHIQ